jgi:hypothetical protein
MRLLHSVLVIALVGSACEDEKPTAARTAIPSARAPDPSPSPPVAPEPPAPPTANVEGSQCLKTARKLFKQAKGCGVDIGDRTAEKTCGELFSEDQFSDDQAVGRLKIFMRDGCKSLRIAIENDRI